MSDDILVLTFEGSQTIEKAEQVRSKLLEALKGKRKEILINVSKVEKVDLSFFQLLHSAGLEADAKGVSLSLSGAVPPELADAVRLAGFDKNIEGNSGAVFSQILGEEE